MPPDEMTAMQIDLARVEERVKNYFEAVNKRLDRIEALLFGTIGTAGVGLVIALLTHSIKLP